MAVLECGWRGERIRLGKESWLEQHNRVRRRGVPTTYQAYPDLSSLKRELEGTQRERNNANLDRDQAKLERNQANLERDLGDH